MFERLNTPEEAFNFQLGAALKMEHTVLEMLDDLIEASQDEKLKKLFQEHRRETEQHVKNVERVFETFGWEADDSPSPIIQALEKEGKSSIKKSDESFSDAIILQSANETEHHEIAVYENLIINAEAMGKDDAVALLRENLEQERKARELVEQALREVVAVTPKQPVGRV
ncbi:MAG TPA: DUF892 family protein [Thermoleophilaceae bacterium]